jgi:hypothetical protein
MIVSILRTYGSTLQNFQVVDLARPSLICTVKTHRDGVDLWTDRRQIVVDNHEN